MIGTGVHQGDELPRGARLVHRGVRPSEHALRHVGGCDVCRPYRNELKKLRLRLQSLNPPSGWRCSPAYL